MQLKRQGRGVVVIGIPLKYLGSVPARSLPRPITVRTTAVGAVVNESDLFAKREWRMAALVPPSRTDSERRQAVTRAASF